MARVTVLCPDLLFGSRVEGGLGAAGHEVTRVEDEPATWAAVGAGTNALVVDLGTEEVDGIVLVDSMLADGTLRGVGTLGFYPHVEVETRRRAEAAGFDLVIVETVGVGQSETMVADLTDIFAMVLAPHGGDDLQGVKRGVMEAADLILVNKADRDPAAAAHMLGDYAAALRLMRRRAQDPEGFPAVMTVSALSGQGLEEAWAAMERLFQWRREAGHLARVRAAQRLRWFEEELFAEAMARVHRDPRLPVLRAEVEAGRLSPAQAARRVIGS